MNNGNLFIALALFFILFSPLNPGLSLFSGDITGSVFQSLFWRLPAIILVFFLLPGKDQSGKNALTFSPARDFSVMGIVFPVLCLFGFFASFLADRTGFPAPVVIRPSGTAAWVTVIFACFTIGYLEEAYFRVYLPLQCAVLGKTAAFWFPALLFSFCHIYEGPWGFSNALLAAVFLLLIYKKTSSVHGIALAHGLYNMAAFVVS